MSRSAAGDALTDLVLPVFELNGEFLAAAADITAPSGLTPPGGRCSAPRSRPLTVAEIARQVGLGLARQSVQRVADLLVARGWAQYHDNPAHKRARLLAPTESGHRVLGQLREAQHAWSTEVGDAVGREELERMAATIRRVVTASRSYRQALAATDASDRRDGPEAQAADA